MPNHPTAYETDFYAWTQEQARLLDARQFDAPDIPHLVEEITSLGKSAQRELYSRLSVLLTHLLKLHYATLEIEDATMPETCPWRAAQVLDADFWPEA
jgi:hypothetical protein